MSKKYTAEATVNGKTVTCENQTQESIKTWILITVPEMMTDKNWSDLEIGAISSHDFSLTVMPVLDVT